MRGQSKEEWEMIGRKMEKVVAAEDKKVGIEKEN